MTKRTIEGYRPRGLADSLSPGHRYVSEGSVDALIQLAGPLPDDTFEVSLFDKEKDAFVDADVTAREKIVLIFESAAALYHLKKEWQSEPSATQLEKEFVSIEQAATRLLRALRAGPTGDLEKMPPALRHNGGLQSAAALEHQEHRTWAENNRQPYNPDNWPQTRLRRAVEGIVALKRWAARAREHWDKVKQGEARQLANDGNIFARNKGDAPLNEYLQSVIGECWYLVYGREVADGPRLVSFAKAAAKEVGVNLSDDGARERLRRIFWGRRTGKSKSD